MHTVIGIIDISFISKVYFSSKYVVFDEIRIYHHEIRNGDSDPDSDVDFAIPELILAYSILPKCQNLKNPKN